MACVGALRTFGAPAPLTFGVRPHMRHTRYFLIEPKEVALQQFSLRAAANASLLLEPLLTSRSSSDRSSWSPSDVELAVKLSFLAMLREYSFLIEAESAVSILGSNQVTEELFDRWWDIHPLQFDEPSEEMQSHLAAVIGQTPETRSSVVNEWLSATFRNSSSTSP